jgi:hypothetical protein
MRPEPSLSEKSGSTWLRVSSLRLWALWFSSSSRSSAGRASTPYSPGAFSRASTPKAPPLG